MRSGYVVEFEDPRAACEAARRLRDLGYARLDAYGPFPSAELEDALGVRRSILPLFVLGAALAGIAVGFGVQAWTNSYAYPINAGGRPLLSWLAWVPIAFETCLLFAAVTAFACVLVFSKMPRLHDEVFELDGFERTQIDRFWITIGYPDPAWREDVTAEMKKLGAVDVRVVGEIP